MAQDLAQIIFDQFVEMVIRFAKKFPCTFGECDFDYRVRESVGHRLVDVLYVTKDNCCRTKNVIASIDFTGICIEYLISCKWVNYLERIAREFLSDICPKKLAVVPDHPKKCREEPPLWEPFPCKVVTTIINKKPFIPQKEECEIIIQKDCECVPDCDRLPCVPKKQIIIKHVDVKPRCCGDNFRLVKPKNEKFATCRGNTDYNNHIFKQCCAKKCDCK